MPTSPSKLQGAPPRPANRPLNQRFSSGPCAKRPGWTTAALDGALLGRSHRSPEGRQRLKSAIDMTRSLLDLPAGYDVALVPGSDTGAFEMAMWNLLGSRGVDVFAWDVFGRIWLKDAVQELRLPDVRTFDADWGRLPDLSAADFSRDIIFTWNGTTSGVKIPNAEWIPDDRAGLTLCDATSAIFAETIDLTKIDCLTYSWQKVLGGEGAHGMMVLSPRALHRLAQTKPAWPVPKLLRLAVKDGERNEVFDGVTINTPSMLCVEDYLDALQWAERIGGLAALQARASANAAVIYDWAATTSWLTPLALEPQTRSHTSVCLKLIDADVCANGEEVADRFARAVATRLEREAVAYDIAAYRGVPAGLRIWTGATIDVADLQALTAWIDWAYAVEKAAFLADR